MKKYSARSSSCGTLVKKKPCTHTLLSTDVHIRTDHVRYTLRYLHCFSVVSCPDPSDSALNGILIDREVETTVKRWIRSQATDFYDTRVQEFIQWYDKYLNFNYIKVNDIRSSEKINTFASAHISQFSCEDGSYAIVLPDIYRCSVTSKWADNRQATNFECTLTPCDLNCGFLLTNSDMYYANQDFRPGILNCWLCDITRFCTYARLEVKHRWKSKERIPNLSAEQSDGMTVFRISPMASLMLHRCRTGAISLQSRHDSHRSFQQLFLFRCSVTSSLSTGSISPYCTVAVASLYHSDVSSSPFRRAVNRALPLRRSARARCALVVQRSAVISRKKEQRKREEPEAGRRRETLGTLAGTHCINIVFDVVNHIRNLQLVMERWSLLQRIFCVEHYLSSKSIVAVQREFRRIFGDNRRLGIEPSRKIISRWKRAKTAQLLDFTEGRTEAGGENREERAFNIELYFRTGLRFVIETHCCERVILVSVQSAASASATEIKDSRMQLRRATSAVHKRATKCTQADGDIF
ncbi:hypothetical protein ANN_23256 [Periplaneta americana]|uniref:DUF4817 domain-containing protein n=1 Tax=Periplaneta americana TaxID=6978 RepID=A0ABQ8SL06_PERAM|nr:hypothetical protein ANN_23256 [Periplaneta americana]